MIGVDVIWYIMGAGLVVYALSGGADFGGGVLDLTATGRRREQQRQAIEQAIAPIWEANHVWLIFIIVLMFSIFPKAFAAVSIALHIPITIAVIGIVLRGSAFVFRAYGLSPSHVRQRWGRVFSWASALTPIALGSILGAVSSGAVQLSKGVVSTGYFAGWTSLYAVLVGLFALGLFVLLAAVYMTVETEGELQKDFRSRALVLEGVCGVLAFAVLWAAARQAPPFWHNMVEGRWFWPFQGAAGAFALLTVAALWTSRVRLARVAVMLQVTAVVLGFGVAMNRCIVLPQICIHDAGARLETMQAVIPALGVGALLLVPSMVYLFAVFKK